MEPTPVGSTQMLRPEAETTVQAKSELQRQVESSHIEKSGNEEANQSEELLVGEKGTEDVEYQCIMVVFTLSSLSAQVRAIYVNRIKGSCPK